MDKFKQDKGQTGLTVLLSVIVMLFIIGLIVMIFSIMGGELQESQFTASSGTKLNDTLATVTETGEDFTYSALRDVTCTLTYVANASGGELIASGNYTQTNCNLKTTAGAQASGYNNTNINVSYTYTYNADNTATNVMNATVESVGSVTDWFDIFIVIVAMVVLILLTVIIITAIRGSGMVGGMSSAPRSVGTA